MSAERPPPRLFVIPATQADVALVFRRGPSDWYHLLRWDLRHDRFEPGAWLRGRIYPEKCDVSPDGALMVYLVHQGRKHATTYTDAWTGVSRLPWLTALGLWPWGTTYGGGGRFLGPRHVRLRAGCAVDPHPDHPGTGLLVEAGNSPQHASTNEVDGAEWSGRTRSGELIYARAGRIHRRAASGGRDRLVADFAGWAPDPRPAPAWATRPLVAEKPRSRSSGGPLRT
jgi:hypothetical protein